MISGICLVSLCMGPSLMMFVLMWLGLDLECLIMLFSTSLSRVSFYVSGNVGRVLRPRRHDREGVHIIAPRRLVSRCVC